MNFRVFVAKDDPKPGLQIFAPTLADARRIAKVLAEREGRKAEIWERSDTLVECVKPQEPKDSE